MSEYGYTEKEQLTLEQSHLAYRWNAYLMWADAAERLGEVDGLEYKEEPHMANPNWRHFTVLHRGVKFCMVGRITSEKHYSRDQIHMALAILGNKLAQAGIPSPNPERVCIPRLPITNLAVDNSPHEPIPIFG